MFCLISIVLLFLPFKDANSRKQEAEWKEKAIKELEEWYARQDEQLQKTKANNRSVLVLQQQLVSKAVSNPFPTASVGSQLQVSFL